MNLPALHCPRCGPGAPMAEAGGAWRCEKCAQEFPVRDGVIQAHGSALGNLAENARRFEESWRSFDHDSALHPQQLRGWLGPVGPDQVKDALVLEIGCGKGRHTAILQEWGARAVWAVDLGGAIHLARKRLRLEPPVTLLQADLLDLPVTGEFDLVISIGVLHHLPDPAAGFRTLTKYVRPGGTLAAWVYGREGNGWIVRFLDPLRKVILSRLPRPLLSALCWPVALVTWLAALLIRHAFPKAPPRYIPYGEYLHWAGDLGFREIHNIVYDQACPTISHYLSRAWLEQSLGKIPGFRLELEPFRSMSWRVRLIRQET